MQDVCLGGNVLQVALCTCTCCKVITTTQNLTMMRLGCRAGAARCGPALLPAMNWVCAVTWKRLC